MNKSGKIFLSLIIAVIFLFVSGFFVHQSVISWRWNKVAQAAGSMPFQVGLTNVIVTPCVVTAYKCVGTTLCNTVADLVKCTLYADVNGMSAGGTGAPPLLLSQEAIGMSGLTPGGQLIYGATTNSMFISPNAVLASNGGCFNCMSKAGTANKTFSWLEKLDKYIIAGFKSN